MPELQTVVHGASELVVGRDDEGGLESCADGALAVVDGDVAAVGRTSDVLSE